MPQLGDTCRESGVYQCASCAMTLTLRIGQRFPPCERERLKVVNWTLVATDSRQEMTTPSAGVPRPWPPLPDRRGTVIVRFRATAARRDGSAF